MSELYTYAVARVRALELTLFSDSVIDSLITSKTETAAISTLIEKGWGSTDTPPQAEAILEREEEKIWETVAELKVDRKKFAVLSIPKLYQNLKAAVKAIGTGQEEWQYFYEDVAIGREEMMDIIREKEYSRLPKDMQTAAQEANGAFFLHTKDGQLCDIIIDRAALDAIYKAGRDADEEIIRKYAETTVAVADIKIAIRSCTTGKPLSFVARALAPCDTVSVDQLARASQMNLDAVRDYLKTTVYADGAEALNESASAFERWCDNQMIKTITPEKYNAFTIGPVFAYVIARQNEIKTVRIVLSGLRNGMDEDSIRERVRQMYV